ncbi:MAG: oxalate/formate MFS antiporter [Janthinobacterium lividum]
MAALRTRWIQLGIGILCMVMIANLQYGWTLFVLPITHAHGWSRSDVQWAFTVFVLAETWLLPFEGWVIDRLGPRPLVFVGGILVGGSWLLNGAATSLTMLYAAAAMGGIGAGIVYAATVGNALRWFTEKRGLATGLTAAGFGAGSAITIVPISNWIAAHGYESAFMVFGTAQGVVLMIAALFLCSPPGFEVGVAAQPGADFGEDPVHGEGHGSYVAVSSGMSPRQVLGRPAFWLMYAMFVMVGSGGLMATAQLAVIASDYGVDKAPVSILGLSLPALTFALSLDRILNGVTRPFFGWVSDLIGREITMFIAFMLEGIGIFALLMFAHSPVAFVLISGMVFFAWGEIYSLFPALCTDLFGRRHAAANYGMLYTAKGTAALVVPLASLLRDATGSWVSVFYLAALFNITAALLALLVLRPMRLSQTRRLAAEPLRQPA